MGKEEHSSGTDRRQYALIGYVAICVAMVFMTLVLALTSENTTVAQVTEVPLTSTRSPYLLTQQADYAPVAPTVQSSRAPSLSTPTTEPETPAPPAAGGSS